MDSKIIKETTHEERIRKALYPVFSWYLERAWTLIIFHLIKEYLVPFEENCILVTLIKFDLFIIINKFIIIKIKENLLLQYSAQICLERTQPYLEYLMTSLDKYIILHWKRQRKEK